MLLTSSCNQLGELPDSVGGLRYHRPWCPRTSFGAGIYTGN